MTTINAINLIYAARAKHKRSLVKATERKGKRLPDRPLVTMKRCELVDHRCGVFLRK